MSQPPPVELIMVAAERLGDLCQDVTFLGGAVVGLLATDRGVREPRPTKDVDVVIELHGRMAYYELDRRLLKPGFQNDMRGPVCRYLHGVIILDVMPTDPVVLGFSNTWYPLAIETARPYALANGIMINLITPACFLATKMEAFDSPTREDHGDMFASRDFEDVVTLLDGRGDIAQEVSRAGAQLRVCIQDGFKRLRDHPSYELGVQAHLDEGRLETVLERIDAIIAQDPPEGEQEKGPDAANTDP